MIHLLFFLGMVAIPINGVDGFSFLGETKAELSLYLFLPMMALATPFYALKQIAPTGTHPFYPLNWFAVAFFAAIALSFIANTHAIMSTVFLGRHGLEKFISSTAMSVYGFMLAYFVCCLDQKKLWPLVVKPIAVSVALCFAFSIFEVLSWYSGAIKGAFYPINAFVHSGLGADIEAQRLHSVSFEPAAFASYAAFAWPWMFYAAHASKGRTKAIYYGLWLALSGMLALSLARTGMVTIVGSVGAMLALHWIYLPQKPKPQIFRTITTFVSIALCIAGVALLVANSDALIDKVIKGDSMSNLSRLASNAAAFNMFLFHPLTGFGFGQYGFHASQFMPEWGYLSWEVQNWFSEGGRSAVWPPVFSVYARFAAELGSIGLAMWILSWLLLARKIIQTSHAIQKLTGEIPFQAAPLVISCLCVLMTGIPSESLRTPMIWITLGLCCRFLQDARRELRADAKQKQPPLIAPLRDAQPQPRARRFI